MIDPLDLQAAERELRRRLEEEPDNDHAARQLAMLLRHQERFAELVRFASARRDQAPHRWRWAVEAGRALASAGRGDDANEALADATARFVEVDEVWAARLDTLLDLGEPAAALAAAKAALAHEPQSPERRNLLGVALYRTGRFEEAVEVYDQALPLCEAPDRRAVLLVHRANALDMAGRTEDAIAGYTEARRIDGSCTMATLNLGIALAKAGRTHEALAPLAEAEILGVEDHRLVRVYGLALHAERRHREAIALAERVLERRPENADALLTLGRALSNTDRKDEAIGALRHALAFAPGLPEAIERLSVLLAEREDYEGARAVLRDGIPRCPDDANLRYNAASLARRAGDLDEARAHVEAGLNTEGDHVTLRLLAAAIEESRGDRGAARAHLVEAVVAALSALPVPEESASDLAVGTGTDAATAAADALATLDPDTLADIRIGRTGDALVVGLVGFEEVTIARLGEARWSREA